VNTFANSRNRLRELRGKPFATYAIPASGRHEHRMLSSRPSSSDVVIAPLHPAREAQARASSASRSASRSALAALRIAGGIFTKSPTSDRDLMKIVFNIKEDDARNRASSDCHPATTRATRRSVADGFETSASPRRASSPSSSSRWKESDVQTQLLV